MRDYEGRVDCLYLNWVIYGHNGNVRRGDKPTLTSYPRRARHLDAHTKMICRAGSVDPALLRAGMGAAAFWHFLDNFHLPGLRCHDVLMRPMDGYSADFPVSTQAFLQPEGLAEAVIERAYIAHFQFKSEADFMRRWQRGGFANGDYWRALYESGNFRAVLAANNAVYDTYLAAYWHNHTAAAMRFATQPPFGTPPFDNIALNKPSFQSSVFEPGGAELPESRLSGGGNNGVRLPIFANNSLS